MGVAKEGGEMAKEIPVKHIKRILKKRRERILYRKVCVVCGTGKNLTIDHIVPRSKGGSNRDSNLQPMCLKCNQEKADRILIVSRGVHVFGFTIDEVNGIG